MSLDSSSIEAMSASVPNWSSLDGAGGVTAGDADVCVGEVVVDAPVCLFSTQPDIDEATTITNNKIYIHFIF